MSNIQHPEITWAERTGYPSWLQEESAEERDEDALFEERREAEYGWE